MIDIFGFLVLLPLVLVLFGLVTAGFIAAFSILCEAYGVKNPLKTLMINLFGKEEK